MEEGGVGMTQTALCYLAEDLGVCGGGRGMGWRGGVE